MNNLFVMFAASLCLFIFLAVTIVRVARLLAQLSKPTATEDQTLPQQETPPASSHEDSTEDLPANPQEPQSP